MKSGAYHVYVLLGREGELERQLVNVLLGKSFDDLLCHIVTEFQHHVPKPIACLGVNFSRTLAATTSEVEEEAPLPITSSVESTS